MYKRSIMQCVVCIKINILDCKIAWDNTKLKFWTPELTKGSCWFISVSDNAIYSATSSCCRTWSKEKWLHFITSTRQQHIKKTDELIRLMSWTRSDKNAYEASTLAICKQNDPCGSFSQQALHHLSVISYCSKVMRLKWSSFTDSSNFT